MPMPAVHRDNLFGVCHAVAQAFGIDPIYLRILFMAGVLIQVRVAVIAYALCGLAVLVALAADRALTSFARPARPTAA